MSDHVDGSREVAVLAESVRTPCEYTESTCEVTPGRSTSVIKSREVYELIVTVADTMAIELVTVNWDSMILKSLGELN